MQSALIGVHREIGYSLRTVSGHFGKLGPLRSIKFIVSKVPAIVLGEARDRWLAPGEWNDKGEIPMKVGFIGLGNIGLPMAQGLVEPPFQLTVYDAVPSAMSSFEGRATLASTVAEVAGAASWIGVCVRDERDVLDVLQGSGGLLGNCASGTVIAIHSTIRPATIKQLALDAAGRGIHIVDAPVSRGPQGTDATKFVCMVGAENKVFDLARPFLNAFSDNLIHAGSAVGDGMSLKLCNNLATYIEFLAGIEAFRLAEAVGLSRDLVRNLMTSTGNLNNSMWQLLEFLAIVRQDPTPHQTRLSWTASLADKDLSLAIELAEQHGISLPVAGSARNEFKGAIGL